MRQVMDRGRVWHGPAEDFKHQGAWALTGKVVGPPLRYPWVESELHHLKINVETGLQGGVLRLYLPTV
jgi:hypothetical protein